MEGKVLTIHTNINNDTDNSVAILETMYTTRSTSFPPSEDLEEPTQTTLDLYGDDTVVGFDGLQPLSERWSPLGANYEEYEVGLLDSKDKHDFHPQEDFSVETTRWISFEEEQDILTSSLMALTSHFAQVQLRVRQIVEAPVNVRDRLLKDLEQFAFQGIPETYTANKKNKNHSESGSLACNKNIANSKSVTNDQHEFELVDHFQNQITELKKNVDKSNPVVLPQYMLLEKQKVIIGELKEKLNLKVDDNLCKLSADEIKLQVDNAIAEFIGPLKIKEQLVAQLKTQITDLERFIEYLQCDTVESKMKSVISGEKSWEAYNSYAAKKKRESCKCKPDGAKTTEYPEVKFTNYIADKDTPNVAESLKTKVLHSKAHGLINKASLIMQMFVTTHFGAKREQFKKNTLKKTVKGNHWGDLRAQLEVDIQEVASLAATLSSDREKFTKLCKTIKSLETCEVAEETALKNGVTTKMTPACSTNNSKIAGLKPQKKFKSFSISSGADNDDLNVDECYVWQKQNNSRIACCSEIRGDTINILNKELTTAVRKNFAMTLLKLIQHGLRVVSISPVTSGLIFPFIRCLNPSPGFITEHNYRARDLGGSSFMSSKVPFDYEESKGKYSSSYEQDASFSTNSTRPMHAWELILEYYYLKKGDEYNNTPARKLSQSFNLDIVNTQVVTAKENMLSIVGNIIAMHRPYKRSYSAHFRAFVCAGLNCHQLVQWLNLIFSCTDLTENYYTNSSYVARTGFRDALRSIDILSKYNFDLPVDLAIRNFHNL